MIQMGPLFLVFHLLKILVFWCQVTWSSRITVLKLHIRLFELVICFFERLKAGIRSLLKNSSLHRFALWWKVIAACGILTFRKISISLNLSSGNLQSVYQVLVKCHMMKEPIACLWVRWSLGDYGMMLFFVIKFTMDWLTWTPRNSLRFLWAGDGGTTRNFSNLRLGLTAVNFSSPVG